MEAGTIPEKARLPGRKCASFCQNIDRKPNCWIFFPERIGKPGILTGFGIVTELQTCDMAQRYIFLSLYRYNTCFQKDVIFQRFLLLSKNGCNERMYRSDKNTSNHEDNFIYLRLFRRSLIPIIGLTVLFFQKCRRKRSNGESKSLPHFPAAKDAFCRKITADLSLWLA